MENFRQTPSLKALIKIAEALGLPMSSLFSESAFTGPHYTLGHIDKGEELQRSEGAEHGIKYFALAYQQIGRRMDPFIIEYTPATPRDFMYHDTEEFFVLLEGEIEYFLFDDKKHHTLKPGDTLYMQANIPHRVELANGCQYAKGLVIYTDSMVSGL